MGKDNFFNNKGKGVTLIEMLVAVSIFATLVGAISGLFISGIRIQRRILATQDLINQASYAMDYMSRSLRMAKKETGNPPTCLSANGSNYEILAGGGIAFIDYNGICTSFLLSGLCPGNGIVRTQMISGVLHNDCLTSPKIKVNKFKVSLSGESQSEVPNLQPRVTLYLEIYSIAVTDQPTIKIQTSISQRNLDFEY